MTTVRAAPATIDAAAGPVPPMEDAAAVFAAQVQQLYRLSRIGYVGTLVNALVVLAVLPGSVPLRFLLAWVALVGVVTFVRYLLYRSYQRSNPAAEAAGTWCNRFVAAAGAMGCLWGALGSWLLPEDTLLQFIVIFLIGGMVASAVIVLTPVRRAFHAYALPALAPPIVAVLLQGTTLHLEMGGLLLVYLAVVLGTGRAMHRSHAETLRIRFENTRLVARLYEANRDAERANAELSRQVMIERDVERALRESSARLEAVIDGTPLAVVVQDQDGRVRRWNRAAQDLFGWTEAEVIGRPPPYVPADGPGQTALFQPALEREERLTDQETVRVRKDGCRLDVSISSSVIYDAARNVAGFVYMFADITERRRAARREQLEHTVARVLAEADDVTVALKAVLHAVCEIMGWEYGARWSIDPEEGDLRCYEIWHVEDGRLEAFGRAARSKPREPPAPSALAREAYRAGEPVWIEDVAASTGVGRGAAVQAAGLQSAFALPLVVGEEVLGYLEFFARARQPRDAALLVLARRIGGQIGQFLARKQAETHLEFYATHDALTGLPNRSFFGERLAQAVAQADRHRRRLAVLFVDLDRFKIINDTLGHDAGDRVLKELASRLRGSLREGDTVARQGGDEFVVMIEDVATPEAVADIARKILETVAQPIELAGHEHRMSASIGIALYPDDGADVQALLKNADIAMYRAKECGRNNFQFYAVQVNAHSVERLALESRLRRAIERGEFVLHFQPQYEFASGRITGLEALVRWADPERGLIAPAAFIGIAEEAGLITALGDWVLRDACANAARWHAAGLSGLRIGVNLSARQLAHEDLPATVEAVLRDTGAPAETLAFEITESMVMQDPVRSARVLEHLKALGAHLALDDFGTGYSSLGYLKRFPLDAVKLDRSFVAGLPGDDDDVAITRAVIAMAHSMQLTVIAEGVERADQVRFLCELGCDGVQGYLLGEPVGADKVPALLRDGRFGGWLAAL